jgi:hypothetical protein
MSPSLTPTERAGDPGTAKPVGIGENIPTANPSKAPAIEPSIV